LLTLKELPLWEALFLFFCTNFQRKKQLNKQKIYLTIFAQTAKLCNVEKSSKQLKRLVFQGFIQQGPALALFFFEKEIFDSYHKPLSF